MPLSKKVLTRLIGAPLLLAALGGLLYWGHHYQRSGHGNIPLMVLLSMISVAALWEFRAMCRERGIRTDYGVSLAALVVLLGPNIEPGWSGGPLAGWGWISLIVGLYVLSRIVLQFGTFPPEAGALSFMGYGYVSLLVFLLVTPVPGAIATYYLLFLLAAGKGSDMAAYCVGKTMGKHKMAPVVSPNKTWEGGIGGAIVGTAVGFIVIWLTPLKGAYATVPWPALLFFALLVTIAAQVGDLVKSAFKRWAGVKDSGRLLPEFGGMLDMVDSFLVCAPVAHLATLVLLRVFN